MASSTEPRSVSYLDPTILEQLQLPLQIQQNQGRAKGGEDKSNDEDIPSFILQNQGDDASSKQSKNGLDAMNKRSPNIRSIQDLAVYAVACDEYFMWKKTTNNETAEDSTTSSDIDQVLYQLAASDHNHSVVATLFATNRLESAVRAATGYSRGKAPLLKDMIHQIPNANTRKMLELLLLPSGLNLRNLVWHGFLSTPELPSSWCALCLVLTQQLKSFQEKQSQSSQQTHHNDSNKDDSRILDVQNALGLEPILDKANDMFMLTSDASISQVYDTIFHWIPPTHQSQFQVAWEWKDTKPTCAIAILCILLEHCLRIEWCHCNSGMQAHVTARPNAYYVTLDGHGQRHLHDVLLDPYLSTGSKNQLIPTLGGSLTALLTDLFCAPNGGPNLRATVSHGIWDEIIESELLQQPCASLQHEKLCDWQSILIFAMYQCALACQTGGSSGATLVYRPSFSYTAVMNRLIQQVTHDLQSIQDLLHHDNTLQLLPTIDLSTWTQLSEVQHRLAIEWTTADSVWEEAELNVILGRNCNLVRALLDDLLQATLALKDWIIATQQTLDEPTISNNPKQQAKIQRRLHHAAMAYNLYQFSFQLCIVSMYNHINTDDVDGANKLQQLTTALKRSRMVVSTVSTFVHTNPDRARKAYQTYCQGKAVKAILQNQVMSK